RLALTGLHLGDVAEVERRTTHELDVEVTLAERAARSLMHRREGLRHEVVERLALGEARAEARRLLTELLVGERCEAVLEPVHLGCHARQLLEDASFAEAEDLLEDRSHAPLPNR